MSEIIAKSLEDYYTCCFDFLSKCEDSILSFYADKLSKDSISIGLSDIDCMVILSEPTNINQKLTLFKKINKAYQYARSTSPIANHIFHHPPGVIYSYEVDNYFNCFPRHQIEWQFILGKDIIKDRKTSPLFNVKAQCLKEIIRRHFLNFSFEKSLWIQYALIGSDIVINSKFHQFILKESKRFVEYSFLKWGIERPVKYLVPLLFNHYFVSGEKALHFFRDREIDDSLAEMVDETILSKLKNYTLFENDFSSLFYKSFLFLSNTFPKILKSFPFKNKYSISCGKNYQTVRNQSKHKTPSTPSIIYDLIQSCIKKLCIEEKKEINAIIFTSRPFVDAPYLIFILERTDITTLERLIKSLSPILIYLWKELSISVKFFSLDEFCYFYSVGWPWDLCNIKENSKVVLGDHVFEEINWPSYNSLKEYCYEMFKPHELRRLIILIADNKESIKIEKLRETINHLAGISLILEHKIVPLDCASIISYFETYFYTLPHYDLVRQINDLSSHKSSEFIKRHYKQIILLVDALIKKVWFSRSKTSIYH